MDAPTRIPAQKNSPRTRAWAGWSGLWCGSSSLGPIKGHIPARTSGGSNAAASMQRGGSHQTNLYKTRWDVCDPELNEGFTLHQSVNHQSNVRADGTKVSILWYWWSGLWSSYRGGGKTKRTLWWLPLIGNRMSNCDKFFPAIDIPKNIKNMHIY